MCACIATCMAHGSEKNLATRPSPLISTLHSSTHSPELLRTHAPRPSSAPQRFTSPSKETYFPHLRPHYHPARQTHFHQPSRIVPALCASHARVCPTYPASRKTRAPVIPLEAAPPPRTRCCAPNQS